MAFTVDLLQFYKCDCMPFRLVNDPATFQGLMETCLGDLQLNWCLIYLNDISVFLKMPKDHLVWLRAAYKKLKKQELNGNPVSVIFFIEITYILGTQNFRKGH